MAELKRTQTAKLRKMAEEKGVKDFATLERADLLSALSDDKPEEVAAVATVTPAAEEPKALPLVGEGLAEGHVAVGSKAETMRARLAEQPKVRIFIQREPKEPVGATLSVILNGYRLNIQKGVYVDVPEQIADVVMKSQKQSADALQHKTLLSGNEKELQ